MGILLCFPANSKRRPDVSSQELIAATVGAENGIIGTMSALGTSLTKLLSNVEQLEKLSRNLQDAISSLPAGGMRQKVQCQLALIRGQLALARELLTGI